LISLEHNNTFKRFSLLICKKMITYNELYEALRKERYSEQLQPLPKSFIKEVFEYLKDKRNIANKETDLFSDAVIKTKKQFENAHSVFRELMLRRKKKLLELAFIAAQTGISKRDFDNMLSFEKGVFDKIMHALEQGDKEVGEELKGRKGEVSKNKLIVFIKDTDEFLDLKGSKLGPFKKGEIINIPQEIANILIVDGRAEAVEE